MKTIPLVLLGLFLAGCGFRTRDADSARIKPSCLAEFVNRPADLLTRERLAEALGLGDANLKISGDESAVSWSWPSSRTRTIHIGSTGIEATLDNQIVLSDLRVIPGEPASDYVARTYRTLGEAEIASAHESMLANLRDRMERGLITEEEAKIAAGMAETMTNRIRDVEVLEDIGDLARWVVRDQTLALAHRDTLLRIYVDVFEENKDNRDTAVRLARILLSLCD